MIRRVGSFGTRRPESDDRALLGDLHVVDAIALGAGIAAGSIALISFGADSFIEAIAGLVVVWLFTGARRGSRAAERRAQLLIAVYASSSSPPTSGSKPSATLVGRRPSGGELGGHRPRCRHGGQRCRFSRPRSAESVQPLQSSATVKEAGQTQLCAYLSIALLLGLGANAVLGWWWADPLAALAIAGVAAQGAGELARRGLLRSG